MRLENEQISISDRYTGELHEMHKEAKKKKITYTVVELYPHCILLENQKGRICPPYAKLRKMMEGTDE